MGIFSKIWRRLTRGRTIAISYAIVFIVCAEHDAGQKATQQTQKDSTAVTVNTASSKPASYSMISAKTAKEMMDGNKAAVVLDVRTPAEFKERHIAGAVLLPLADMEMLRKIVDVLPDKEAVILVYCRRGNRSKVAASKLAAMGYVNVYEFGGIESWKYGTVRD
jgi:rhodanese-related sulfurtransferase